MTPTNLDGCMALMAELWPDIRWTPAQVDVWRAIIAEQPDAQRVRDALMATYRQTPSHRPLPTDLERRLPAVVKYGAVQS